MSAMLSILYVVSQTSSSLQMKPVKRKAPACVVTTEYTELQPLLSGVHSVMRVKLALAGEGGGCTRPPPFIKFTITSEVAVYAPADWADTLTLFHLQENMYSVVVTLFCTYLYTVSCDG